MKKIILAGLIMICALPLNAQSFVELCDKWGMETPVIRSEFPEKYLERNLDFAMTAGVEKTPGGRLWNCAFGGEDGEKAYLFLTWSDDNGKTWTDVKFVEDPHSDELPIARSTILGNLWTDPQGRLWLFCNQSIGYWDGRGGTWCAVCENPDDEKPVWSEPRRIGFGGALNKPIVLSSGEWVLPVSLWDPRCLTFATPKGYKGHPLKDAYSELHDKWGAYAFVSADQGKTWEQRGHVQFPTPRFDEHNFIELSDGRLWMTARTLRGMYESFSSDKGYTWTKPKFYLPHCNSRHFMHRLSSGAILMVRHGYVYENTSYRRELRAFLSYDEGKTWKGNLLLDERSKITYPSGCQDSNGDIFVSYDYERAKCGEIYLAKFTEQEILNGKVSGKSFLKKVIFKAGKAPVMVSDIVLESAANPYFEDGPQVKGLKKVVAKARKQAADVAGVPSGAIADASAPGGYYWPLLCGIDVSGADLNIAPGKTWNDYCDPDGKMDEKPAGNQMSSVNPCPEGWSLPTEYQLRRMFRNGVYSIEVEDGKNVLWWNMIDGERSEGDIFGIGFREEVMILSGESRGGSKNSVWRFRINRGVIPSLEVSSQDRFRPLGEGRSRSILRCVRNTGKH